MSEGKKIDVNWPNGISKDLLGVYRKERQRFDLTKLQYAHEVAKSVYSGNLKVSADDVVADETVFIDEQDNIVSEKQLDLRKAKWLCPKRENIDEEEKEMLAFVAGFFGNRKSTSAIFDKILTKVKRGEMMYFGDRFVNIKHVYKTNDEEIAR